MAYKSMSVYGENPVFQTFIAENQVPTPVFSFYLTSGGSELYLGSTNPNFYVPTFTYTPVTSHGLTGIDGRSRLRFSVLTINIAGLQAR
jgi:cathepsin D